MSEVPNDLAFDDTSEVGTTSVESSSDVAVKEPKKRRLNFDLFNTILLVSFLFITLALMLMLWHLVDRYGAIWDAPWNV